MGLLGSSPHASWKFPLIFHLCLYFTFWKIYFNCSLSFLIYQPVLHFQGLFHILYLFLSHNILSCSMITLSS